MTDIRNPRPPFGGEIPERWEENEVNRSLDLDSAANRTVSAYIIYPAERARTGVIYISRNKFVLE